MMAQYEFDGTPGARERLTARLRRARGMLAAGFVLFAMLWFAGAMSLWPALAGFAVIGLAALLAAGPRDRAGATVAADSLPAPHIGGPLIDAVLAGLPDPVIALDRAGTVIAFNSHARTIAPALRRGEQVSLVLRVPEVVEAIRRASATGSAQRVEFFERVPVVRWYAAYVTPVPGEVAIDWAGLVLMTFHDLTPLRRVEEMRADFVANASHELRTPLAALLGFIETLQGPARDDPAARERFLAIMQAQANRMARLIDDLLSLSRIELNAHLRPNTPADLVAIVRQVADGLQMLARDRGVEVKVTAPADRLAVLGDRDELTRVFENLVENALKYGASGKRVDVSLSADDAAREARVAVRDHGPGISPEHLPRLTERFYRVDVADSRAQGGTGLGLALVKHILNRHGGRLTIDSVVGQGATFTAHLPLDTGPASPN
jgi:two-component system phosphate regulon sensor histidine kinase PhoR